MGVKSIAFRATNFFSATHVADQKVYLRFTTASDDSDAVVAGANGSAVKTSETLSASTTNAGLVERLSTNTWDSVDFIDLGATATDALVRVFSNNGTAGTGFIRVDTIPSNSDTLQIGLTGFEETATFVTTVSADNHIKVQASTASQADAIASWIDDSAFGSMVDGTDWQRAGTAPAGAHAHLDATASSVGVVTVRDKLSGARQLAWNAVYSGSGGLTINNPDDGVDGTQLTDSITGLAAGQRYISTDAGLDLDSPAVSTMTLPAGLTGPTAGVLVAGRFDLVLRTGTPFAGTAPALDLELSHDNTNWFSSGATMPTLTASDVEFVTPNMAQYARLNFTSNGLSTQVELDAKFITQSR